MAIKKQDFVEIEYTGKLKEEGMIFDTSDEKTAKDNGLYNKEHSYGAVKVMIGNSQVLPGLDRFMEGKEPGEYKVVLDPTEGFGKKNAKLLRLVPKNIFIKQQINPMPGLPINIDGADGVVKTVSGGRCMVDFNHPLSGKTLEYDLKINRIVTDEKEKVSAILELQVKKEEFDLNLENGKIVITLKTKGFQKPLKDLIEDMIKKFTKVKEVSWKETTTKELKK
jgi:FKBP-type peptidyl-prolyl cis-trans isomerase SlyD